MNALKTPVEDTNEVKALNALSSRLWSISPDSISRSYASRAFSLANKLNYKKGMAAAYFNIGLSYDLAGDYPQALKNYMAALKISEDAGDKNGIAYSYMCIGSIYWHQGNYYEAL